MFGNIFLDVAIALVSTVSGSEVIIFCMIMLLVHIPGRATTLLQQAKFTQKIFYKVRSTISKNIANDDLTYYISS